MMLDQDRYARLAAKALRGQNDICPAAPELDRDKTVAAMAVAIGLRARRRKTVVAVSLLALAAAGFPVAIKMAHRSESHDKTVAAVIGVESSTGPGELVRGSQSEPLSEHATLAVDDTVRLEGGSTTLALAGGTRITLSGATQVRVDELGSTRRFSLAKGHLSAQVAKLGPHERFLIDTPDAQVEVRGTSFTVDVEQSGPACGGRTASSVAVSEGTVWVRSGGRHNELHAGASWRTSCADEVSDGTARPAEAGQSAAGRRRAVHAPAPTRSGVASEPTSPRLPAVLGPVPAPASSAAPPPPRPVSSLAEQNNLLSAAMAAERRGEWEVALRRLGELLDRYPDGPLVETARAERQRILQAQSAR
jgi:hypothetical protein